MKECWISIDWLRLPEPIWQSFKNIIKTTPYTEEDVSILQSFEFINNFSKVKVNETYKIKIKFQSEEQSSCDIYKLYNFEEKKPAEELIV